MRHNSFFYIYNNGIHKKIAIEVINFITLVIMTIILHRYHMTHFFLFRRYV